MRPIDADALIDYCNNLIGKTIDANDIARFPTAIGWISVKDRLPMLYENVLVYYVAKVGRETGMTITNMSDVLYFGANPIKVAPRWKRPWQYFFENNEITHWMPLPKAPKEETDGA